MLNVIRKPSLQPAERVGAQRPTAIYKSLINPRHLSDVDVAGSKLTVRQQESHLR